MATFVLLLGFALFKISIGLTLIWLGLRGGEPADGDDEGFGPLPPDPGPPAGPPRTRRPRRRPRVVARARRGPARSPAPRDRRPARA